MSDLSSFNWKSIGLLCTVLCFCLVCVPSSQADNGQHSWLVADQPLTGEVEDSGLTPSKATPPPLIEPMAVPVLPKSAPASDLKQESAQSEEAANDGALQGKVEDKGLTGSAAQGDDSDLQPQLGKQGQGGYLKGAAKLNDGGQLAGEDPDAEDQELQIEWDRWRNRFLRAVLAGAMESLNDPEEADMTWDPASHRYMVRYPMGTVSWFYCQVTKDHKITNLRIDQSSGYPNFDRAVLNAVHSLQGSSILTFPAGSRRMVVSQSAGVRTSDRAQPQQFFKFGDVEHYRVPAY